MRNRMLALLAFLGSSMAVNATPIYDSFGPFPDATWGGSGIPNDVVAASKQIVDGTTTITIAMSATQRYSNPAPGNNGAGVYFAQPGSNYGGAGESTSEGALWNFNYYVKIEDSVDTTIGINDYEVKLFYDFDPGFNTPLADLGVVDISAAVGSNSTTLVEDSQNLMFGWLAGIPSLGFVTPPVYGSFDPNAIGEYSFGIQVGKSGWGIESVAIDVQTVPVPAAVWLFGSGLLGLVGIARRRKA